MLSIIGLFVLLIKHKNTHLEEGGFIIIWWLIKPVFINQPLNLYQPNLKTWIIQIQH